MTTPATHRSSPVASLDLALQRVRLHGGRLTAAKRSVAALLFESDDALSAQQIIDRVGIRDRSIIYRCLTQFEELGIAEHVHLGHGHAVYRRSGLSTVPVACMTCGTVVDLESRDADGFAAVVLERTGVQLDLVHFPLTGRCTACAVARDPAAR